MGYRPEQVFIIPHDETLCGVLFKDYAKTAYEGLRDAFRLAAETRQTDQRAAPPKIEVGTEGGLFLAHSVNERDAVFIHDDTMGQTKAWATLDNGELAFGTRVCTGGPWIDWDGNPVALLDTVDLHSLALPRSTTVSLEVEESALDRLRLYSATAFPNEIRRFDPSLYLLK